ncbi:MAG: ComF family protein [Breznakia sp.]
MSSSRCLVCFSHILDDIDIFTYFQAEDVLCGRCRALFKEGYTIQLQQLEIEGLYEYNEDIENLLYTYKEGHDIALATIFLELKKTYIKRKYRKYRIVFAPSSVEKQKERGFATLKEIFQEVALPKQEVFVKINNRKQSLQPYHKREKIQHAIAYTGVPIKSEYVLLVDDVCTSGNTLLAMYRQLKKEGYIVKALVLAIHPSLLVFKKKRKFYFGGSNK